MIKENKLVKKKNSLMKNLIYLLFATIYLTACQSTTNQLGEKFVVKNPITVDDVISQLNTNYSIKDVQVEGKITKSCMSEGCWFTINDASGKEILFDVKDKKFRVPINSPDKLVVVLADAQLDTTAAGDEKNSKYKLSAKGLLFK
jgi:uncharacterized lipoprotein YajG